MESATARNLIDGAARVGVPLGPEAVERFGRYLALLVKWNARINLTRIVSPEDVVAKHFVDSLAIVPLVGEARTLVDVGSGPGFPGVPAAIARPGLRVTLVESIQKKCAFLEAVKRELALPLEVRPIRLKALVEERRTFDVAVSRATLAPEEWVREGAPLVAPGGLLLAMLGRERPTVVPPAGLLPPELREYTLPGGEQRALLLLRAAAPA